MYFPRENKLYFHILYKFLLDQGTEKMTFQCRGTLTINKIFLDLLIRGKSMVEKFMLVLKHE